MTAVPAPLSVLHVSQPTHGGVAVYVVQAVREQIRRGWRVAVACPAEGELAADLAAAGIEHLPWRARRSPGPGMLGEALELGAAIGRFDPDVVHLHSSKAGLVGRLPLVARNRRVIFQPHGWSWLAAGGAQGRASLLWERAAARRADALVCVGQGELDQGRRAGVRGAAHLIRNGVDRRRFHRMDAGARTAARAELGLPEDAPVAVCVGRVTRQKGQDVLLDAWPRIRARCPRAVLALVGDGDAVDRLRERSEAGVMFVPAVADTRRWLAASTVMVLPSRWEGLPLTALEALAAGRSLVATGIPGLAEVVTPGTGALVAVEDPAGLAEAVAARLLDPALADAEGAAAAMGAAAFDAAVTFARLADLTYGLVGEAPVDGAGVVAGVRGAGEPGAGGGPLPAGAEGVEDAAVAEADVDRVGAGRGVPLVDGSEGVGVGSGASGG
ncbi:glycosyltransferase [Spirillospora sp. CA-253888]